MCLLAFGVVMVFSASSSASLLGATGDGAYYLKRTLMFGASASSRCTCSRATALAVRTLTPMFLLGAVFLLLATKVIGAEVNALSAGSSSDRFRSRPRRSRRSH